MWPGIRREIEEPNMRARHFDFESDKGAMKRLIFMGAIMFAALLLVGCGRKSQQAAPPPPEVLVTTVQPQDVPRVLERVATLDGFINANINAQVQGYIVSRDYQEDGVPSIATAKVGDRV